MSYEICHFKKIALKIILVSAITSATIGLGNELSENNFLDIIKAKDNESNLIGYKVTFMIATQHNQFYDPDQGMVFKLCEATWAEKGAFAMRIKYNYEKAPVFKSQGQHRYEAVDYDREGNLIVWRPLEKYIFFTPDRNETIEMIQSFYVDPNSKVLDKTVKQITRDHYAIGSCLHMYEFKQSQNAVGRGFSRYLSDLISVSVLESGLTKLSCRGSYGKGIPIGIWELKVDPNSDYLVREAIFSLEGSDEALIEVTSSGTIRSGELTVAKSGSFRYSKLLDIIVEVTDLSKVADPNQLCNEVMSRLDQPLPSGSHIVDHRGKKPIITTVR